MRRKLIVRIPGWTNARGHKVKTKQLIPPVRGSHFLRLKDCFRIPLSPFYVTAAELQSMIILIVTLDDKEFKSKEAVRIKILFYEYF